MKKIALVSLLGACLYANSTVNGVINDIKKDGSNYNLTLSTTYQKFTLFDTGLDGQPGEIMSEDRSVLYGKVGLVLLPNTWEISLSYSGAIKESDPTWFRKTYTEWDGTKKDMVGYDEGEIPTRSTTFYMNLLKSKYGNLGLGYESMNATFGLQALGYIKAVDTLKEDGSGDIFEMLGQKASEVDDNLWMTVNDGNGIQYSYINLEKKTFYLTYALSDNIPYVPYGFGFKVGYQENDYPVLIEQGKVALNPETTSMIYGLGITQSINDLRRGFSFKELSVSMMKSKSEFYNYETNKNQEIERDYKEYRIAPAYVWKWGQNKKIYASVLYSLIPLDEFKDSSIKEMMVEIGLKF